MKWKYVTTFFVIASCSLNTPKIENLTHRENYVVARSYLEQENFSKSEPHYKSLVNQSTGALKAKFQLELAHVYLRQQKLEEAMSTAKLISNILSGTDRLSALGVIVTAQHEKILLKGNEFQTKQKSELLKLVRSLKKNGDISTLGPGMLRRLDRIAADIAD